MSFQVLSDPEQRMVYDEINGYALTSVNPFLNPRGQERDHAFVDEFTCIGTPCYQIRSFYPFFSYFVVKVYIFSYDGAT